MMSRECTRIVIDDEFKALIPSLSADELVQLRDNVLRDGCRDPLVVWRYQDHDPERGRHVDVCVLIDGHNRHAICTEHDIDFDTVEMEFDSRDDAKLWIVQNQLGRRNLTDFVKAELALVAKPLIEAKARANAVASGERFGKGSLNSDEPIEPVRTDAELAKIAGVGKDTVRKVERIKETASPELLTAVRAGEVSIHAAADIATLAPEKQASVVASNSVAQAAKEIRAHRAEERREQLAAMRSEAPPLPDGRYECIVIDPPWDMQKIERDVRPNQVAFDYPTMTEEELARFDVPGISADDAHLFCWTTHKHLPSALRLIEAWGYRYVCTMVWHKPGGFQPIGLPQYNCEFALYARRGSPSFIDTKAFPTCFEAPRREHSRKPDEFYDTVRRVTAGPRIDVFSRESRDGFDTFGNEAGKFDKVA